MQVLYIAVQVHCFFNNLNLKLFLSLERILDFLQS